MTAVIKESEVKSSPTPLSSTLSPSQLSSTKLSSTKLSSTKLSSTQPIPVLKKKKIKSPDDLKQAKINFFAKSKHKVVPTFVKVSKVSTKNDPTSVKVSTKNDINVITASSIKPSESFTAVTDKINKSINGGTVKIPTSISNTLKVKTINGDIKQSNVLKNKTSKTMIDMTEDDLPLSMIHKSVNKNSSTSSVNKTNTAMSSAILQTLKTDAKLKSHSVQSKQITGINLKSDAKLKSVLYEKTSKQIILNDLSDSSDSLEILSDDEVPLAVVKKQLTTPLTPLTSPFKSNTRQSPRLQKVAAKKHSQREAEKEKQRLEEAAKEAKRLEMMKVMKVIFMFITDLQYLR